jgi:hypothetical protein
MSASMYERASMSQNRNCSTVKTGSLTDTSPRSSKISGSSRISVIAGDGFCCEFVVVTIAGVANHDQQDPSTRQPNFSLISMLLQPTPKSINWRKQRTDVATVVFSRQCNGLPTYSSRSNMPHRMSSPPISGILPIVYNGRVILVWANIFL